MHRISYMRFTGTAAMDLRILLAMCGDTVLRNVVVVTDMWGRATPEIDLAREQESASSFFKPALNEAHTSFATTIQPSPPTRLSRPSWKVSGLPSKFRKR